MVSDGEDVDSLRMLPAEVFHGMFPVFSDQVMLDVTDIPDVHVGSEVIVFGGRELPMELVAEWADTICYEIICNVSPRVPREYVRGN